MCGAVVLVQLAAGLVEPVAALDFSTLPAKGVARYEFEVQATTATGGLSIPLTVGMAAAPDVIRSAVQGGLKFDGWDVSNRGPRVYIRGRGREPVANIKVLGDGPKPALNWTVLPVGQLP